MPSDIPHFCFEMVFTGPDSVLLDNGYEKFGLPYSRLGEGCRYKISGASLYGDMYFSMSADTSIALLDTAWTKLNTSSEFRRVGEISDHQARFETRLNACMLAGKYALFKEGQRMPGMVDILDNGQINGLRPFLGYDICYAGDCLETTSPPAATIEFVDNHGEKQPFVFKCLDGKRIIQLYSIGAPIPDVKGERSIGAMVYELRGE